MFLSHTPPSFNPGSLEAVPFKRARANTHGTAHSNSTNVSSSNGQLGSDLQAPNGGAPTTQVYTGRLRSASDLCEEGLITQSEKGAMKDLIINNDPRLPEALEAYQRGSVQPLKDLIRETSEGNQGWLGKSIMNAAANNQHHPDLDAWLNDELDEGKGVTTNRHPKQLNKGMTANQHRQSTTQQQRASMSYRYGSTPPDLTFQMDDVVPYEHFYDNTQATSSASTSSHLKQPKTDHTNAGNSTSTNSHHNPANTSSKLSENNNTSNSTLPRHSLSMPPGQGGDLNKASINHRSSSKSTSTTRPMAYSTASASMSGIGPGGRRSRGSMDFDGLFNEGFDFNAATSSSSWGNRMAAGSLGGGNMAGSASSIGGPGGIWPISSSTSHNGGNGGAYWERNQHDHNGYSNEATGAAGRNSQPMFIPGGDHHHGGGNKSRSRSISRDLRSNSIGGGASSYGNYRSQHRYDGYGNYGGHHPPPGGSYHHQGGAGASGGAHGGGSSSHHHPLNQPMYNGGPGGAEHQGIPSSHHHHSGYGAGNHGYGNYGGGQHHPHYGGGGLGVNGDGMHHHHGMGVGRAGGDDIMVTGMPMSNSSTAIFDDNTTDQEKIDTLSSSLGKMSMDEVSHIHHALGLGTNDKSSNSSGRSGTASNTSSRSSSRRKKKTSKALQAERSSSGNTTTKSSKGKKGSGTSTSSASGWVSDRKLAPYTIGQMSPETRRKKLDIFAAKRQKRVWHKRVKYSVRKNFADSRMRIKGRFVSKGDEETLRALFGMTTGEP